MVRDEFGGALRGDRLQTRNFWPSYQLEIGAGLGALAGKVWRIGQMGYASNSKNILYCLSALDAVLTSMNAPIKSGAGVKAAVEQLNT